jgi:hypothetical protein
MNKEKMLDAVARYFRACNTCDFDLFKSAIAEDVTSYFTNLPPIHGRENFFQFFKMLYDMTNERFTIDRTVIGEQEVVLEWSMLWTPPGASEEIIDHGIDWLMFQNDLIVEARSYGRSANDPPDQPCELKEFSYQDRNYPCRDDFDSRLP